MKKAMPNNVNQLLFMYRKKTFMRASSFQIFLDLGGNQSLPYGSNNIKVIDKAWLRKTVDVC